MDATRTASHFDLSGTMWAITACSATLDKIRRHSVPTHGLVFSLRVPPTTRHGASHGTVVFLLRPHAGTVLFRRVLPCGPSLQLCKLDTPCASLRSPSGPSRQLRKLSTPCALLQFPTRAFTTASLPGYAMCVASVLHMGIHDGFTKREETRADSALCVGSHTNDPCVFPSGENMVFNALHAARMRGRRGAGERGVRVRHAAPARALSQHRGPTPPQKKKRKRASHSHLSPFIVHDAQSDEIFHVRRGPTATTILCPCLFSATWTCPGFTDVHKFRCLGVSEFLECVRCFGAVFVSLGKFLCEGLRFESQDNSARQLST